MLQAAVVPNHLVLPASAHRPLSSRPLARVLFVAGAVGLIGVTVDLVRGPPASALPAPTSYNPAQAALLMDHSVVKNLIDVSLEPGASVAAYETSANDTDAKVSAPAVKVFPEDKALEPGASIAAYGS